jgi:LacI family transcriptional regulator, repressor for deo operon, udp, cdd, tsx, nupC, and nupG
MGRRPTSRSRGQPIYAWADEYAPGAVRTLRRAGLDVPGDLSVIGIDDHPLAELTDLSTVRQPVREQGVLAGQMLLGCFATTRWTVA